MSSPSPHAAMCGRRFATMRPACVVGLLAGCLLSAQLPAAPLLRCHIDQGGTASVVDFKPVADPYGVKPVNVNDRFRFKAVVIGDAVHVEYIKLYVYAHTKREPMLLHQTSYLLPTTAPDAQPMALTGVNHVYAPGLEREMQYGCALLETGS